PVVMVQPADHRMRAHAVQYDRLKSASLPIESTGTALADTLMRTSAITIIAITIEQSLKMVFAEHQNLIQTLAPYRANQPLAMGIRLGCHGGRTNHACANTFRHVVKSSPELGIVVAKEELGPWPNGVRLRSC